MTDTNSANSLKKPPPSSRYFNRELSWLEFNQRVLDEAKNPQVPLLERLKFLAITASNLDEFFMVRVGGLQLLANRGSTKTDPTGLTAEEQLGAISDRTHAMALEKYECFLNELEPVMQEHGIQRVSPSSLRESQASVLEHIMHDEITAVLTPMAVSGRDDFPLLTNMGLNVCVRLEPAEHGEGEPRFALIPFGQTVSRFITLPSDGGYEYVLLEDAVQTYCQEFFPGETIVECVPFRILRNADMGVREDQASDLLAEMEEVLDARKQSGCVRLEISDQVTSILLRFLQEALDVDSRSIYAVRGPVDLGDFMQLTGLRGFEHLCYESWPSCSLPQIDDGRGMFDVVAESDVLLYHPFDSFDPVLRLLEEAASDPEVLAIKQILYRTSKNSPVVGALRRAAESGKYVTAIVELKARFDEARNIEWAKDLEQAGVQVIYGVRGLKTHAKICVIVRREPQGIRRYVHFGTGNYNESTAKLYTDASLMTCREEYGADASSFINAITGYSKPQEYLRLAAAPINLRERVLELIRTETESARAGNQARIIGKLNSLVDPTIIDALYEASRAGVQIELNIRGICCLKPGVSDMSENIRVVSIIDRFLEHARIFYFHHGGDELVFISSADWMPRNLDRRVELLVPVPDANARKRLIGILESCLRDNVKGKTLQPNLQYESEEQVRKPHRSQQELYEAGRERQRKVEQTRRTVFEPHRAPDSESETNRN